MAGLHPQNIGKVMDHGYAGGYARQPDMIVNTRPAGGADNIPFGMPLKYDADGNVIAFGTGSTAADFVGVASKEIKTELNYLSQQAGQYAPGEAVSTFQRGAVNVKCQRGAPALNGAVYVRIVANEAYPNAVVGGFEASADVGESTSYTVQLTNCKWAGPADANGIAEMRILTMTNA